MAVRFTKLDNALAAGLKTMAAKAAVSQIEYWEQQLADVDVSGAKGIISDLDSLKKKLQADEIDGDAVKKLLGSLGEKTTNISARVEEKGLSEHLAKVGEGLSKEG